MINSAVNITIFPVNMSDVDNSQAPVADKTAIDNLDDDKINQNVEFKGATLQLESRGTNLMEDTPTVEFKGQGGPAISRDRPQSGISNKSTSSKTSRTPGVLVNNYTVQSYFCQRPGAFENAVEQCKDFIKNDLDGDIKGAWLLTEIDHWDNNKEKIVILTEYSVIIVKYDFIAVKVLSSKRIMLHLLNQIQIGDFVYPEKSVMPPREHGGVRATWIRVTELTWGQKWNPFASDIPYITFAHHPLAYSEKERETITYNVDDFYDSFVQQTRIAYQKKKPGENVNIVEGPILIESYASLSSMVFNQSHLGYSRERGGISF